MLKWIDRLEKLNFSALMAVYVEGNRENAALLYPDLSEAQQLLRAEQDFYAYLSDTFFHTSGARYAVWEENGTYVSALRLEPYRDGLLLEALETLPQRRRQGYAAALITAVQACLAGEGSGKLYSHVNRRNQASLAVHRRCGFQKVLEFASYIDGSVNSRAVTLMWQAK